MKSLLVSMLTFIFIFTGRSGSLSGSEITLPKKAPIPKLIYDSKLNFEEAIAGTPAPKNVIQNLCLVDVRYYSFDGKLHQGQLVVHNELRNDLIEIFDMIEASKFPIKQVKPIIRPLIDQHPELFFNNTSCFNYRNVANTDRLSHHAFGRAIDINPWNNPLINPDGTTHPENAVWNIKRKGTFNAGHFIVKEFLKRGWRWGGYFKEYRDNHHFDKMD